jgi:hypothetical protein
MHNKAHTHTHIYTHAHAHARTHTHIHTASKNSSSCDPATQNTFHTFGSAAPEKPCMASPLPSARTAAVACCMELKGSAPGHRGLSAGRPTCIEGM